MIKISLLHIESFAFHGVHEDETKNGNHFYTDVTVWYNKDDARYSDKLEDAFNYQLIYDAVNQEMQQNSKLLEHVAERIAQHLLQKEKLIEKVYVAVSKANPPISGKADFSRVEIEAFKDS